MDVAWPDRARRGAAWRGSRGGVGLGKAGRGHGVAVAARRGQVGLGRARRGVAAEVGRLHRAHKLMQRFKVIDNRSPGEQGPQDVRERIRLFSAIPSPDDPTKYEHHPTEDIIADPMQRALLLRDAERLWKGLKARYGHLQEFVAMVQGDLGEAA